MVRPQLAGRNVTENHPLNTDLLVLPPDDWSYDGRNFKMIVEVIF